MKLWLWVLAFVSLSPLYAMNSDGVYRVLRTFRKADGTQGQIVINGGKKAGLFEDMVFRIYRYKQLYDPYAEENDDNGVYVELARARSYRVTRERVLARVEKISEADTLKILDYPIVMNGDFAIPVKINIKRVKEMTKVFTLFDADLFDLVTHEIRSSRQKRLVEIGNELASYKNGTVIIEGHTDRAGRQQDNRLKSFEKAQHLKRYLVAHSRLVDEDIVSVGYGESDPYKRNNLPGEERQNNRLIIKFVQN